jgi:hypothetical protein
MSTDNVMQWSGLPDRDTSAQVLTTVRAVRSDIEDCANRLEELAAELRKLAKPEGESELDICADVASSLSAIVEDLDNSLVYFGDPAPPEDGSGPPLGAYATLEAIATGSGALLGGVEGHA